MRLRPEGVARVDDAMESLLLAERALLAPLGGGAEELAALLRTLLLTFEADAPDAP